MVNNRRNVRNNLSNKEGNKNSKEPMDQRVLRINRDGYFMPRSFRTTFRYYEQINLSSNSTPFIYVFRGNQPFDPNQTGTGSQPVGWDNFLTFYNSSFCVGSRIEIFISNGISAVTQIKLVPTIASNSLTSYDQASLFPNAKTLILDGTSRGGNSYGKIVHQMSTLDMFSSGFDRDFVASGNAAPAKNFFWTIAMQSSDQATLLTLNLQVTVYYDIIFADRIFVSLS